MIICLDFVVFRDNCVHWMLLVSFITSLALLVKLVNLENTSDLHQVLMCALTGLPVGLKMASLVRKSPSK